MKVFIWERIGKVSCSWHDHGGLLIVASTLEDARKKVMEQLPQGCEALTDEPDHVLEAITDRELICVFPDAGCC